MLLFYLFLIFLLFFLFFFETGKASKLRSEDNNNIQYTINTHIAALSECFATS